MSSRRSSQPDRRPTGKRAGTPHLGGRARRPVPRGWSRSLGGEQVEGRRAVRALLAAGRRRVRDVWVSEDTGPSAPIVEIVDLASASAVPVRRMTRTQLEREARTDAPQGVLAHAAPLPELELPALCRVSAHDGGAPFLVALEGVTDPRNLGAVLRSAVCAGATGAVLPRHRSALVTPTVTKSAAGAVEHLPIAVVGGVAGALSEVSRRGIWTVGLDPGAPTSLFDLELATEPVAVVVGSEESGLSALARRRCDVVVSIPQTAPVESLNVAAAAAVACFEVARKRAEPSVSRSPRQ